MPTRISLLLLGILLSAQGAIACDSDYLDLARQGKSLFNGKAVCFGCHGRNADPSTVTSPDVATLNPKPTDLRRKDLLKHPSDEQRFVAIRNGIPGTAMVPYRGHLTSNEIALIIEYLEVLKQGGC
jgi:mono/diheme cytochrome c family protein